MEKWSTPLWVAGLTISAFVAFGPPAEAGKGEGRLSPLYDGVKALRHVAAQGTARISQILALEDNASEATGQGFADSNAVSLASGNEFGAGISFREQTEEQRYYTIGTNESGGGATSEATSEEMRLKRDNPKVFWKLYNSRSESEDGRRPQPHVPSAEEVTDSLSDAGESGAFPLGEIDLGEGEVVSDSSKAEAIAKSEALAKAAQEEKAEPHEEDTLKALGPEGIAADFGSVRVSRYGNDREQDVTQATRTEGGRKAKIVPSRKEEGPAFGAALEKEKTAGWVKAEGRWFRPSESWIRISEAALWMARCMYAETNKAREQELVGWVIRNRLETHYHGQFSYKGVVLEENQFSPFNEGAKYAEYYRWLPVNADPPKWKEALRIAAYVVKAPRERSPFSKTTRHFFSQVSMKNGGWPPWAKGQEPVAIRRNFEVDEQRFRFFDLPGHLKP